MSLTHQLSQTTSEAILTEEDLDSGVKSRPGGHYVIFDHENIERGEVCAASDIPSHSAPKNCWLHWSGLEDTELLATVFDKFGIHPLMAEDILNLDSRTKIEEVGDAIFVALKLPVEMDAIGVIETVHFCLYYQTGRVVTFSEIPIKFFDDIQRRLDDPKRRIRNMQCDYLFWALLDMATDHALRFSDFLNDRVEEIEDRLIAPKDEVLLEMIHGMKNEVSQTYRILRPFREVSLQLTHSEVPLLSDKTRPYFRDLNDHAVQTVELLEHLRDKATSLRELYFTAMSHRMNEVMKVLTSLSAIFLPLTFLAGIYGMNFENMPELTKPWAYPVFMGLLATITIVLVIYFKRRKWL